MLLAGAPACAGNKKPPCGGFPVLRGASRDLALASLEARVRLADHEDLAATTDHLAVAVTGLRRLKGGQDFHDTPREMG